MAKKANWTLKVGKRSVNDEGVVEIEAELLDTGKSQGTVTLTMTPARELRLVWTSRKGAAELSDFRAYATTEEV